MALSAASLFLSLPASPSPQRRAAAAGRLAWPAAGQAHRARARDGERRERDDGPSRPARAPILPPSILSFPSHAPPSLLSSLPSLISLGIYFGIRKFSTHWVSLGFFCTLVPLSVFSPEVHIPLWALVHLPVVVTVTTAIFTPKGWLHAILYVLFENAMGFVKMGAVVAGVLDLKHANEWVVTTKLGSSDKRPGTAAAAPPRQCRVWPQEAAMSVFVLTAALYSMFSADKWSFAVFLTLQGLVFLAFGLNWIDAGNVLGQRLGGYGAASGAAVTKAKAEKATVESGRPLAKRTYTL